MKLISKLIVASVFVAHVFKIWAVDSDYASEQLRLLKLISSATQRIWIKTIDLSDGPILTSLKLAQYRSIDFQIKLDTKKTCPNCGTFILIDKKLFKSPFYFNDTGFFPEKIEEVTDTNAAKTFLAFFLTKTPTQKIQDTTVSKENIATKISTKKIMSKHQIKEASKEISRRLPRQTIWQKNNEIRSIEK